MTLLRLFAVPWDSGHRGLRMGAGPLRLIGKPLLDALTHEGHTAEHVVIDATAELPAEVASTFELARTLAGEVHDAAGEARRPVVLSGGCSSALGTVAGLGTDGLGIVWFDSHGDLNTPGTTTSGFVDGMAAATLVGRCWKPLAASVPGFEPVDPARLAFVGLRDLDPPEAAWLHRADPPRVDVRAFRRGHTEEGDAGSGSGSARARAEAALAPALARLEGAGARRAYVHVDLDVLDPGVARVNDFQAPDGLTLEELLGAIELIGERLGIAAGAVTSFDPDADPRGRGVGVAIEVVKSLARAG